MPETEFATRIRNSYKEYSVPRNHVEMKILLDDLRAHPGEWAIYLRCRSYADATRCCYNAGRKNRTLSIYRDYPQNIQIVAAVDPENGPIVAIRWVP